MTVIASLPAPAAVGRTPTPSLSSPGSTLRGAVRPRRSVWRILGIVLAGGLAVGFAAVLALAWSLWPGGEVRALRRAVGAELGQRVEPRFTVGVGGLILGVARAVTSLTPVDPAARSALSALRGADVSVARLTEPPTRAERPALLAAADGAMEKRGWQRLVGVLDGRSTVGVYVPRNLASARDVRVAVLVIDGTELVTVAARADLEPLLRWAEGAGDWRAGMGNGGKAVGIFGAGSRTVGQSGGGPRDDTDSHGRAASGGDRRPPEVAAEVSTR